MHSLLAHVLAPCSDPDCEVHCIEVGLAEETVTDTDLAFFIAGAQAMSKGLRSDLDGLDAQVRRLAAGRP